MSTCLYNSYSIFLISQCWLVHDSILFPYFLFPTPFLNFLIVLYIFSPYPVYYILSRPSLGPHMSKVFGAGGIYGVFSFLDGITRSYSVSCYDGICTLL